MELTRNDYIDTLNNLLTCQIISDTERACLEALRLAFINGTTTKCPICYKEGFK